MSFNEEQEAKQMVHGTMSDLYDLIKDVRTTMLCTAGQDGVIRARPMATQTEAPEDGNLWFFTFDDSRKADEIKTDMHVCVAYSSNDQDTYVSVSGRGHVVYDKVMMEKLYSPFLKAWFPQGLETPHICLLKVEIEKAEYWDNKRSKMIQFIDVVKAAITGKGMDTGEHGVVEG